MAEIIVRKLVDDIEDGEVPADATHHFTYNGRSYRIDLSNENAGKMDEDFQRWIKHARLAGHHKKTITSHKASDPDQLKAIRDWARRNGWPNLSDKGRVPGDVQLAFEQRHDVIAPSFSAKA